MPEQERQGMRSANFDLIRLLAAFAVLFDHSWTLAGHQHLFEGSEVLKFMTFGMGISGVAVGTFFIISGYLITKSLCTRQNIPLFLAARALRIYPALWAVLFISVFIMGAGLTVLPLAEYFSHHQVWLYIWQNLWLHNLEYTLPGVFLQNPYPGAINGSLWTLPYELGAYALTFLVFSLGVWRKRLLILCFWIFLGVLVASQTRFFFSHEKIKLLYFYGAGMMAFLYQDKKILESSVLKILFFLLYIGLYIADSFLFKPVGVIFLSLLLFHVGLHMSPLFPVKNDISYGIYIYAFPVQQTVALFIKGISGEMMFFYSALITAGFAWCSCKWIEQPALKQKQCFAYWIEKKIKILTPRKTLA